MLAGQIDDPLDIVATMNAAAGGETPFTTHKDLYSTINTTILGNAPWGPFQPQLPGQDQRKFSIMANRGLHGVVPQPPDCSSQLAFQP